MPLANLLASSIVGGACGHPLWPMRAMTLQSFLSRLPGQANLSSACHPEYLASRFSPETAISNSLPPRSLPKPLLQEIWKSHFLIRTESTGKSYPPLSHFWKYCQRSEHLPFCCADCRSMPSCFLRVFRPVLTDLTFHAFYTYFLPHPVLPSFGKMPMSDVFTKHTLRGKGKRTLSLVLSPRPCSTCSLGSGNLE